MNFKELGIEKIRKGILQKEFSVRDIISYYLDNIRKFDKNINAFLEIDEEKVKKEAERVDNLSNDEKKTLKLLGVPIAVKDNILVEGVRCTAGSKILQSYIAPYDATVIERLKKEGAVIIGKTNLDEFAMGSSCENSAFFPTRNPFDKERVAGGSSGGSAAAVAADLSTVALGSDTGGSIRLPASFCGVVGFKPSYGAVSRYGLIALASSLDQIGPITKTVEDARLLFEVIAGRDRKDATSWEIDRKEAKIELRGLKVGIPKEYFEKKIDASIRKKVDVAVKKLEEEGVEILNVSLPLATDISLAAYYIIMPSEASANLARYDGIRYGMSEVDRARDMQDVYFKTRGKYLGEEVKRRIMLGTFALSSGYYDAYYLKAQKARKLIAADFDNVFKKVDILLTPSSPSVAFKIGERTDPLSMYLSDIFMTAVNLAGLPAISIPWDKINNLPLGIQFIGNFADDLKVLKIAELVEDLK